MDSPQPAPADLTPHRQAWDLIPWLVAGSASDAQTALVQQHAAGCADYPESDGYTAFLPSLLLAGGVPDQQWAEAVKIVEEVAGASGFGPAEVVVDRPGQHQIVLSGERESRLSFGTTKNATRRLEAGCHLPERDHS